MVVNLCLGHWKRSVPCNSNSFAVDVEDEPHLRRRNSILRSHPGIVHLYGFDAVTKLITILCSLNQLLLAYFMSKTEGVYGNIVLLVCSFVFGGSFCQISGEIIHECCHNLLAKDVFTNRMFGLLANITVPFPIAMSFKKHHLNHHAFQGILFKDPDLPLEIELKLIRGNCILKIIWLALYPVMYAIRGLAVSATLNYWECVNVVFMILFDLAIYYLLGVRAFVYMCLSLWFGYSFHPAAAHFIQEHYTFTSGQETYSYYGSLNSIFLNIGYHNEHHDFPQIPWSKLPLIYAVAPEYYAPLMCHTSWIRVIFVFLFDPMFGPQSRVVRNLEAHLAGRRRSVLD